MPPIAHGDDENRVPPKEWNWRIDRAAAALDRAMDTARTLLQSL